MPTKPVTMDHVSEEQKEAYIEAAKELKGGYRRQFMARIVNSLGYGGTSWAQRELGWNRDTILRGQRELEEGVPPRLPKGGPGRPRLEAHLPTLLDDIKSIVDAQSQTDATFRTGRLYTRLSVPVVRQALIDGYGYSEETVPSLNSIRLKLKGLGYKLRSVKKNLPKKKSLKPTPSLKS